MAQAPSKRAGIGATCIQSQTHAMGPRLQGSARFVKADVTVSSDTKQLEIDSAKTGNNAFESSALPLDVANVAGEKVHVIGRYVDVTEQVLLHELTETVRIRAGKPDELVEVHRVALRQINAAGPAQSNERFVNGDRCLARRQPEHRCWLVAQLLYNDRGRRCRRLGDGVADPQFHIGFGR